MQILIVDDDRLNRELAKAIVTDAGHSAVSAACPSEALALLDQQRPDLIFMDVEMPEMNGFELTRIIRERLPDIWFPIIFLSGRSGDAHLEEGIRSGGDDYLHKPIRPIILEAKIRAMERILLAQTSLTQANQSLQQLAMFDPLTGCLNRRGMLERLNKEWDCSKRNRAPLSLLMLDIDHFKKYNDHYGHPQGDVCLEQVSHILKSSAQRPRDVVARYGGEEFLILLPETDLYGAGKIADRILQNIRMAGLEHIKSELGKVSLSIGFADQRFCSSAQELIACADQALYEAKGAGRNQAQCPLELRTSLQPESA